MRIENRTPWKTEHLRAIAVRVLDEVAPRYKSKAMILFVSARGFRVTGYAYTDRIYFRKQGPYWFTEIRIPSPNGKRADYAASGPTVAFSHDALRIEIASVIAHETGHWKGFSNRELHGSTVHDTRTEEQRQRFAWAAEIPLEPAEKKTVPIDIREARRVRDYQTKVSEWQTKIKRSQTALTKWRRRLALAESRLQKAARP